MFSRILHRVQRAVIPGMRTLVHHNPFVPSPPLTLPHSLITTRSQTWGRAFASTVKDSTNSTGKSGTKGTVRKQRKSKPARLEPDANRLTRVPSPSAATPTPELLYRVDPSFINDRTYEQRDDPYESPVSESDYDSDGGHYRKEWPDPFESRFGEWDLPEGSTEWERGVRDAAIRLAHIQERAQFSEGPSAADHLLDLLHQQLPPGSGFVISTLRFKANMLLFLNRIPEAKACVEDILTRVVKHYAVDSLEVASCKTHVALMAVHEGDFDTAERLQKECIPIFRNHDAYTDLLESSVALAYIHDQRGQLAEAEQLYLRLLSDARAHGQLADVVLVEPLTQLASVYHQQGKHDDMIRILQEAASIAVSHREGNQVAGVDSDALVTYTHRLLGDAFVAIERPQEAEQAYLKSVHNDNVGDREYAFDDTEAWDKLGSLYMKMEKYADAKKAFHHCLEGISLHTPDEQTLLPRVLYHLGMAQRELKNYKAALAAFEDSRRHNVTLHGPSHPTVLACLTAESDILSREHKYTAAIERISLAVPVAQELFGKDSEEFREVQNNLGFLLGKQKGEKLRVDAMNSISEKMEKLSPEEIEGLAEKAVKELTPEKVAQLDKLSQQFGGLDKDIDEAKLLEFMSSARETIGTPGVGQPGSAQERLQQAMNSKRGGGGR